MAKPTGTERPKPQVPLDKDMDDSGEAERLGDRSGADRLLPLLELCTEVIVPRFLAANAVVGQRRQTYLRFAQCAAWLGACAVLFAIIQLAAVISDYPVGRYIPGLEFGFALAAVIVALVGLGGTIQQKWFQARYTAEKLRLLKYEFLMRPVLWSGTPSDAEDCRQGLAAEVRRIIATEFSEVQAWMTQGTLPQVIAHPGLPMEECSEIREYYLRKRLLYQIDYLEGAKNRNLDRNNRSRTWPSVLFFGSVSFVLAHFCVEAAAWHTGTGTDALVGKVVLIAAAGLPVCGAGIRVIRGVFEYGRNASRNKATHGVLLNLSERLRKANEPAAVFREMGFCEQVMEADLREYMRLMVEAEWFG
jgi:hypothetical protein